MKEIDSAISLFNQGFNCSQSVFSTFAPQLNLDTQSARKIAAPFGGGIARLGETCGAVIGALMVIGLKHGYTDPSLPGAKDQTYQIAGEFIRQFKERNGSTLCRDLLGCDLSTPDGLQLARKKNFFGRCPKYIQDSIEILADFLLENPVTDKK